MCLSPGPKLGAVSQERGLIADDCVSHSTFGNSKYLEQSYSLREKCSSIIV